MELAAVLIIVAFVVIFCGPALATTLGRFGMALLRSLRRITRTSGHHPSPSKD